MTRITETQIIVDYLMHLSLTEIAARNTCSVREVEFVLASRCVMPDGKALARQIGRVK